MAGGARGVLGRAAVLSGGFLAVAAAVAVYGLLTGPSRYALSGNPFPGAFVSAAEPVGYFVMMLLSALCMGALIAVAVTAKPEADGLLDPAAFRIHLVAERISLIWLIAAGAMAVVQAAHDAGVGLRALLGSGALFDAIGVSEMARGWIVVLIFTLPIAVTLRFSTRWVSHVVLLSPAVIAVVAPAVTGNPGQGPDHDFSTSSAIVFAVAVTAMAGLKMVSALVPVASTGGIKVLYVACGALALSYGAILLYLLVPGWSVNSDFARLGLGAGAVVGLVWLVDCLVLFGRVPRSGARGTVERLPAVAGLAMTAALGAIAAMAVQTAPRFLAHRFTGWDVYLGYELAQPPAYFGVLSMWRFDTFIGTGGVVLAIAYLVGYLRLRRRGTAWPAGRLVSWLCGCAALVFTSSSGLRTYGSAMFSIHMTEHMILNMFIPVLLVLGGPVTLALRVLPAVGEGQPPGPREWVTWLLHSRVTTFLSNPIVAFVLFVGSPYVVYFTSLFDTLVRYHWGHEFMTVHFLLVGYLFYWAIIGIDPGPRRLPYPGRIGLLFAVMPFHAFFGIALMTMAAPIGTSFYRSIELPWVPDLLADQHLGGGIAWGLTEVPVLIVIVALVSQWARQDRRAATRADRHADSDYAEDDLEAYNAMLHELSRMRR
ncbi:cytochrome c oxidase assembly protein [Mycobacterium sp.]|uniref:cytochrome c oxidase assembly protein n=1 Tax=Mycobacterium sp. TaxID=1785 RepID=UPI003A8A0B96